MVAVGASIWKRSTYPRVVSRVRSLTVYRQRHSENSAASRSIRGPDLPPVHFHDGARDSQAQPRSALMPLPRFVAAIEALEEVGKILLRDAGP